jgi:hypothetical protein
VLNVSVGALQCELCVCDVDSSGAVVATDALRILSKAAPFEKNPELSERGGRNNFDMYNTPRRSR